MSNMVKVLVCRVGRRPVVVEVSPSVHEHEKATQTVIEHNFAIHNVRPGDPANREIPTPLGMVRVSGDMFIVRALEDTGIHLVDLTAQDIAYWTQRFEAEDVEAARSAQARAMEAKAIIEPSDGSRAAMRAMARDLENLIDVNSATIGMWREGHAALLRGDLAGYIRMRQEANRIARDGALRAEMMERVERGIATADRSYRSITRVARSPDLVDSLIALLKSGAPITISEVPDVGQMTSSDADQIRKTIGALPIAIVKDMHTAHVLTGCENPACELTAILTERIARAESPAS